MATQPPEYVIVGRGNWALRMHKILAGENRNTVSIEEAREQPLEGGAAYEARLREQFSASKTQIAWLCVPPGPHVTRMTRAALLAGLHVVAEKPWFGSPEETAALGLLASEKKRIAAVHYQYCLLDEVAAWRARFYGDRSLVFGGRFHHSRPSHAGISALDNLGTHLLSIREWAAPGSRIGSVDCAYGRPDQRVVWLERDGTRVASIDLLASQQPIVQRFIAKMEQALESAAFPFDLQFAMRVSAAAADIGRGGAEAVS
jgi:predicted dehydrogenase